MQGHLPSEALIGSPPAIHADYGQHIVDLPLHSIHRIGGEGGCHERPLGVSLETRASPGRPPRLQGAWLHCRARLTSTTSCITCLVLPRGEDEVAAIWPAHGAASPVRAQLLHQARQVQGCVTGLCIQSISTCWGPVRCGQGAGSSASGDSAAQAREGSPSACPSRVTR